MTTTTITIAASDNLTIALVAVGADYRSASSWSEEDRIILAPEALEAAQGWLARHPEIERRGSVYRPRHSDALIWDIQSRNRRRRVAVAAGKRLTHAKWVRWGV